MPLDELSKNRLPTASTKVQDAERARKAEEREADLLLVAKVRGGNYNAFETLVKKHQRRVFALALGILKNTAEAEEIVQETFLSSFEKLDSFREEAAFSSWLFRIATNFSLMRLRKKKPELKGDVLDLELQMSQKSDDVQAAFSAEDTWSRSPDVQAEARELRVQVSEALSALPEESRALLLLRAFDDMSMTALAATFGLSVAATKSRLHRARLQLKNQMNEMPAV
ncbi:MAG: sigma-70 family RNA polymerase sigma factor [Deltaproteobacteria bacterium]|nr:sigma-70 family RNA polymerase sigma factor [Deltaproteobacteria bacterium]